MPRLKRLSEEGPSSSSSKATKSSKSESSDVNDDKLIRQALRNVPPSMKALAENLQNKIPEVIDSSQNKIWKNQLLELATTFSKLDKKQLIVATSLEELKIRNNNNNNNNNNNDSIESNENSTDVNKTLNDIKQSVNNKLNMFNTEQADTYKKIKSILKDLDDDLEMISTGLTQADFTCPYSRLQMDKPVRHKKCGHRCSYESMQALLKTCSTCFQPGCNNQWTQTSWEYDKEHETKMLRWLRQKESATAAVSQAINLEDKGNNVNTTQL